jgi:hypothetical protein
VYLNCGLTPNVVEREAKQTAPSFSDFALPGTPHAPVLSSTPTNPRKIITGHVTGRRTVSNAVPKRSWSNGTTDTTFRPLKIRKAGVKSFGTNRATAREGHGDWGREPIEPTGESDEVLQQ